MQIGLRDRDRLYDLLGGDFLDLLDVAGLG